MTPQPRNYEANPECVCGHAKDGHWKRRAWCMRKATPSVFAPPCPCRHFLAAAVPVPAK